MTKCLYCDSLIDTDTKYIICNNHWSYLCCSCFCICHKRILFNEGCIQLCDKKLSIINKYVNKYRFKCNLCGTIMAFHHCSIPIKNKYMNINIL